MSTESTKVSTFLITRVDYIQPELTSVNQAKRRTAPEIERIECNLRQDSKWLPGEEETYIAIIPNYERLTRVSFLDEASIVHLPFNAFQIASSK